MIGTKLFKGMQDAHCSRTQPIFRRRHQAINPPRVQMQCDGGTQRTVYELGDVKHQVVRVALAAPRRVVNLWRKKPPDHQITLQTAHIGSDASSSTHRIQHVDAMVRHIRGPSMRIQHFDAGGAISVGRGSPTHSGKASLGLAATSKAYDASSCTASCSSHPCAAVYRLSNLQQRMGCRTSQQRE